MNAGAFTVLSAFTEGEVDATRIENLAGLGKSHPWLAAGLSLCLLSLAGIPPTMGFVGKFYLFTAAVQSGETGLAIIGALSAAAGVYYYLRPMVWMYMHEGTPRVRIAAPAMFGLGIAILGTIVFGLYPAPLLSWASASLASLLG